MAQSNVRNVLRLPGDLIKDPTNLSASAPYGGTYLGLVKAMHFRPGIEHHPVTAEEWGNTVVDVVHAGSAPTFGVTLRELDNDAVSAIFLDTAAGDPSGDRVISFRADNSRAGTLVSTKEMKLLFVPKSPLRHPSFLIRAALPVPTRETEIALRMGAEATVPVLFYARPDSSNRLAVIGKLKDLSL